MMKKFFISLLCGLFSLNVINAASIDTTKASAGFGAFKLAKKEKVNGTFKNITFKFGKKKDSITSTLKNASATMNAMDVTLNDATRDASVKKFFFSKFKKDKKERQLIKVTFKEIIEGENLGTILANVSMNGKTQKIPMQYTISNGKFFAKGVLDVLDFGLAEAFKSLAEGCKSLHEGVSWTQVEIYFEAPIK